VTEISRPIAQLRAMLAAGPDPETMTISERRAGLEQLASMLPPAGDLIVSSEIIEGVSCDWIDAPDSRSDCAILYCHGGGYVAGSAATHRALGGALARAAGSRVLMLDYRLAPEHAYPAALEDVLAVYSAVVVDGGWAIAGDSAGGGLALVTAQRARDQGLSKTVAMALFSPWTDLACTGQSHAAKATADPMLKTSVLRTLAGLYVADGMFDGRGVSPLYGAMAGLPPMLLQVGSDEILLDDTLRLDFAARKAGIDVTLEVWPEMVHVFQAFLGFLPEATAAITRTGTWLRRHWKRDASVNYPGRE
jgi:monoterpene epsilon-lactone hydrolase